MSDEYTNILQEIKNLEELIHPETVKVSELETFQAKMRYFFDNFLYERFHDLSSFVEYMQLPESKKQANRFMHVKERAIQSKEDFKSMFFSHHEYWDFDEKTNLAIPFLEFALGKAHHGECLGINELCERCTAEAIYKLPPSKTWTNEQGIQMYERLQELKKMEVNIKLAQSLENELSLNNSNITKTKI